MSHVRRHAAEVGQAILSRQLAIFFFEFVGQPRHLVLQRGMRLLEPQRRIVPRRENRREAWLVAQHRVIRVVPMDAQLHGCLTY